MGIEQPPTDDRFRFIRREPPASEVFGRLLRGLGWRDETACERAAFAAGLSAADWSAMHAAAVRHGVAANFYHALKPFSGACSVPDELMSNLHRGYLVAAARNLRLHHDLERVLLAFAVADIPSLLLKGAHLAEEVYGNLALRGMGDIDVLVREADLDRVEEVMSSLSAAPEERRRVKSEEIKHFTYRLGDGGGLRVEVHWKALNGGPTGVGTAELWARARPLTIGSASSLGFRPEDLLSHLCLHTVQHLHRLQLRMLCDLAAVIRRYRRELDWSKLVACAVEWHGEAAVLVMLTLAREWLSAEVPEWVFARLQRRCPEVATSEMVERVADLFVESTFPFDEAKPALGVACWWETRGVWGKMRHLASRIFSSPESLARHYGAPTRSWRRFLYYPARLADLRRRHGRSVWRLIAGGARARGLAKKTSRIEALRCELSTCGNEKKKLKS